MAKTFHRPIPLRWTESGEPEKGFQPRRLRTAATSLGVYEVFQNDREFEAWFTKQSGVLVHVGKSQTANGAREMCETHARGSRF